MKSWTFRLGWMALGIAVLYGFSAMAGVVSGGSLDPPGPVGSTMKSLADVPPSWHQELSSTGGCTSVRFSCVMGGEAVLDNETGLVWEKTPANSGFTDNWFNYTTLCTSNQTGGRFGWRMPTAEELLSLKDPNSLSGLPPGHPFSGVEDYSFWTSTSAPNDPGAARYIRIGLASNEQTAEKADTSIASVWCVRGGQSFNPPFPDEPGWSKKLGATVGCDSPRFTCVLDGAAVLDHETGLVWERTPQSGTGVWSTAYNVCGQRTTGDRGGWRLPTREESQALMDPAASGALPAGNPFTNVNQDIFWTASAFPDSNDTAYAFGQQLGPATILKSTVERIWCVRGAGSYDGR